MRLYNSLTRAKETLIPLDPDHVRLYTCGPTVYNFAHIGNFRAYVFEDILRRAIRFQGFRVTQVMNLTDVDDKTIRGAQEKGVPLKVFTAPFVAAFFEDIQTLNIEAAEHYPAATDHVPGMIALIQRLLDRGLAYTTGDGSVYFSVSRWPAYGRLARLDRATLRTGSRVAMDEYEKEGYGDFALWKGWEASDGDVVWEAPWGRGRPGWHIECSAMATQYLGETFDIHTGGIDNLFPHHENEIAQSEAASDRPFARMWLHCAHLRVNGEKMSKSAGNFFTLRDLLEKGWAGREIRYALLNGHYRQPLNFTFDALEAARAALARLDACVEALQDKAGSATPGASPAWALAGREAFREAVADDLNLPEALAAIFGLTRDANTALAHGALEAAEAAAVAALFAEADRVLGVMRVRCRKDDDLPADVLALATARLEARGRRDWAESDRLRDELAARGWTASDGKEGQKLKRRQP